jgi:hypothetical protein
LNIDLEINNKQRDCKMGAVRGGTCGRGGRMKEIKVREDG